MRALDPGIAAFRHFNRHYTQYSSLNDSDGGICIDAGRALVAAAQGEVAHFPLDPTLVAPVATRRGGLVEDFLQHRFMELVPLLRGE